MGPNRELLDGMRQFFANRLVCMTGIFQDETEQGPARIRRFVFSGMVMSFDGEWYYVTAGHCLKETEELIKTKRVDQLSFIDYLGSEATDRNRIPIVDFCEMKYEWIYQANGIDVGYVKLDQYYKELFCRNKILPIDEVQWANQPNSKEFFHYELIGTPIAYVDGAELDLGMLKPELLRIGVLQSPPQELVDTFGHPEEEIERNADIINSMFYGRISNGQQLPQFMHGEESIVGMSGGPVLGFTLVKDEMRYWVVAMQSTWHRPTRTIKATPVPLFASIMAAYFSSVPPS